MKKTIVAGLLTGVAILVVGVVWRQLQNLILPSVETEYQNLNLFRPWSDPIMSLYYLYPFILGIILAWLWKRYLNLTGGNANLRKAINFSVTYWIVTLPGMVISYSSYPISIAMISSWTINGLISSLVAGLVLFRLFR